LVEVLREEVHLEAQPERDPMADFYGLQHRLLLITGVLSLVIFPVAWLGYSFNTAVSYLLGAFAGLLYFRLLGKYVADLGVRPSRFSALRYVIVVFVFLVPIKYHVLELMPTFVGFLTFKLAILGDGLWTVYHDLLD